MAQRRMFSPDIVSSEEFLSMPISSQALYFHLGMDADDDGFIQPQKIMRQINSAPDDLNVLLAKRFLLDCKDGVVVIKHWLIHNMIRADRYKPTRFQDKKNLLFIKENKAYSDKQTFGCQNDNRLAPQVRLGKVSKESAKDNFLALKEKEEENEESNENTDPEGHWNENNEGIQIWVPSKSWRASHKPQKAARTTQSSNMTPRSFKKETFVYDDYMAKLRGASLVDKIVAFIWDEKGYNFENLEQVKTQFGMDAVYAKKLTGYSKDQVARAIRKAKDMGEKGGFDWKASTVVKVIAEINKNE